MSPSDTQRQVKIAPSVMCADLLALGREVDELVELGADYLHLDMMDGHYVPNLTLGTDLVRQLGTRYSAALDIHLMVDEPDRWAPVFTEAALAGRRGSNPGRSAASDPTGSGDYAGDAAGPSPPVITIHPETTWHPARTLAGIAEHGGVPAIAVDPAQRPEQFRNLLELARLVLVMTVNPGYAGQKLVPWTLESVEWLAAARDRLGVDYEIEVDGNVSWENIPRMLSAGADVLVAGTSSLFDPSMARHDAWRQLRTMTART